MSQLNNFLSGFSGHPASPFYGSPLDYLPGVPDSRAPISAMRNTCAVRPHVNVVGDRKFAVIDPEGDITGQIGRAIMSGFKFVEIGQPGSMRLGTFMELLTHTHGLGVGVIARNAARSSGPYQYLSHPNVFGCVVEREQGSPQEYARLRRDARKDGLLPVWFVFDGADGADGCADEIRLYDLKGMGVSYGAGLSPTKYDDSHPVLNPNV
jgi:hypothetical protein